MRKLLIGIILIILPLGLAFAQSDSQWYIGKPIKDITFTGLVHVQKNDLQGIVKPYIGQAFTDTLFWDLQSKLYALDYFEQFTPTAVPGDPGKSTVTIDFSVIERPIVSEIQISGNTHVARNDILGAVVLKKDDIVTKNKIRSDVEAVKNLYLERGFPEVQVTDSVETNSKDNTAVVVFSVAEGAQTKVKKVLFTGNSFASESTLRGLLSTKEQSLFNSGIFQESNLAQDKSDILKYYQERGYEDVEVTDVTRDQEIDKTNNQVNLIITFHIKEGPQYTYAGTTFHGNTLFTTKQLTDMVSQKVGAIINKTRLDSDFGKINDLYLNDGYIFNTIDRKENKDLQNRSIAYDITIVERGRAHIENIIVKGTKKTKDYVVRRELPLEVGDVFSKDKIIEGLRNLYNTQYFTSVTPETPAGSVDGLMDLVLNVEEARTTDISLALSVSGAQTGFPLIGSVKLADRNFMGLGEDLSVGASLSSTEQNVTFGFSENWLFGQRWSNSVNLTLDHTLVTTEPEDILAPIFTGQTNAVPDPYDGHYVFAVDTVYPASGGPTYKAGDAFPGVPSATDITTYNLVTDYSYAIAHSQTIPQTYLMTYDSYSLSLGFNTGYAWYTPYGRFNVSTGITGSLSYVSYDPLIYRPFNPTVRDNLNVWQPITKLALLGSWDTRDIIYSPSSGIYLKQALTYTGGFLPSVRQYIETNSDLEAYYTLFSIPVSESWNFKLVADVRSSLSFIFPQFWSWSGTDTLVTTSQDLLYIDGMSMARGWPRQINGESLWDNWLELRIPIVEQYLWWDFYLSGTAMWATPAGFSSMSLNNFLFSTGGGIRLVIPGLPIGLYFAKRFQILNGQLQWQAGNASTLGLDFVISFNASLF